MPGSDNAPTRSRRSSDSSTESSSSDSGHSSDDNAGQSTSVRKKQKHHGRKKTGPVAAAAGVGGGNGEPPKGKLAKMEAKVGAVVREIEHDVASLAHRGAETAKRVGRKIEDGAAFVLSDAQAATGKVLDIIHEHFSQRIDLWEGNPKQLASWGLFELTSARRLLTADFVLFVLEFLTVIAWAVAATLSGHIVSVFTDYPFGTIFVTLLLCEQWGHRGHHDVIWHRRMQAYAFAAVGFQVAPTIWVSMDYAACSFNSLSVAAVVANYGCPQVLAPSTYQLFYAIEFLATIGLGLCAMGSCGIHTYLLSHSAAIKNQHRTHATQKTKVADV